MLELAALENPGVISAIPITVENQVPYPMCAGLILGNSVGYFFSIPTLINGEMSALLHRTNNKGRLA
jgi:hypothetical protein